MGKQKSHQLRPQEQTGEKQDGKDRSKRQLKTDVIKGHWIGCQQQHSCQRQRVYRHRIAL